MCMIVCYNCVHRKAMHVLRVIFQCCRCKKQKRTWSSSRFFGGQYLANQKYVYYLCCIYTIHAMVCITGWYMGSHVLVSCHHSTHMCKFLNMGVLGHDYIRKGLLRILALPDIHVITSFLILFCDSVSQTRLH